MRGLKVAVVGIPKTIDNDIAVGMQNNELKLFPYFLPSVGINFNQIL